MSSASLPLPLAPFEQYMLLDDRVDYPMVFQFRLAFRGSFRRELLRRALEVATAQHPLLAATIARRGRRSWWVPAAKPAPTITWIARNSPDDWPPCAPLDLTRVAGLRVWALEDAEQTDLVFQVHHACSDGLGALQFTQDLLVVYDRLSRGASPALEEPREPQQLRHRARFGLTGWKLLRMLPQQLTGLIGAYEFMQHQPVPLVPARDAAVSPATEQPFSAAVLRLSADETTALRASARRQGVALNDLLLRDLFRTLAAFRHVRRLGDAGDWLRLSVPINLRSAADARMPAANMVSMVFLDRSPRDCDDGEKLLAGIHQQMQLIKRRNLGLTFVFSVAVLSKLRLLRRMTHNGRCAATTVFTNLLLPFVRLPLPRRAGQIQVGELELQAIEALPPLRPLTEMVFSALTYAGRLTFSACYNPRLLQPADAEAVLEDFGQRLRQSAASDAVPQSSQVG